MKQVEIWGALNLDDALKRVKAEAEKFGCVCWAEFNMKKIYSTDSIDDAYLKVRGCTKAEHDEMYMYQLPPVSQNWNSSQLVTLFIPLHTNYSD